MASDQAFGDLPERAVSDASALRVGDIIHTDVGSVNHWVIVTEVGKEIYHFAEGNTGGEVSWNGLGRLETLKTGLAQNAGTIFTRYPQ